MDSISSETINILKTLTPGFIVVFLINSLRPAKKRSNIEFSFMALMFTGIVDFTAREVSLCLPESGFLVDVAPFGIAILFGLLFSGVLNHDLIHKALRKVKVTKESAYPSILHGVFMQREDYVTVFLETDEKFYGWPKEFPTELENECFVLQVVERNADGSRVLLKDGFPKIEKEVLLRMKDIKRIEFEKKNKSTELCQLELQSSGAVSESEEELRAKNANCS
jgi:hypothetical protein